MASRKVTRSAAPLALAEIKALARMVHQYDLSELELDSGNQRLRIRRERGRPDSMPFQSVAPQSEARPTPPMVAAQPEGDGAAQLDDGSALITSPFVGTFYRAPSPDAPPFVEANQMVKKGQVLCIVEAMKLMNEIEAESDCKIVEILGKNAEVVEFGQSLFRVIPIA